MNWIRRKAKTRSATSKMYETIRKIKGQPMRKVNILKDNDQIYASVPHIAEKLARTFCQTSSNQNYTQEF